MKSFDTVILGGGVIGCALAYELSKNGQKVAILERRTIASGASGVSAAMLEAQLDAHRGEPFLSLALASRDLFPNLWQELKGLTGIDFQYERCGILQIATNPSERQELEGCFELQKSKKLPVQWLEPEALAEFTPQLEGAFAGALFHIGDGQVNASRFTAALAEGAKHHGAQVFENVETTGFLKKGSKVDGVVTSQGTFHAQSVAIAAGPWSTGLGKLIDIHIPVEPVRGQLVIFEAQRALLPCPVFYGPRYLTPKMDGFLLAGTTTERVGFDCGTTEEAVNAIIQDATALMPMLKSKTVRGSTSGLRPYSPDGLPILGGVPSIEGLYIATGHYRNGILLAPISAKVLSSSITKREPSRFPLQSFSIERFSV